MSTLAEPLAIPRSPALTGSRLISIDLLRGTVMIVMALDHVRDYFHAAAFQYDPTDLSQTSVSIFFTRWITHFCAPVFMLLSGTSAYLVGKRKSKRELSSFLLKRGLWLIFLEMVVMNFGWNFDIHFNIILFIVIWALGVSMIALAGLIHLPFKVILAIGIVMVAGHNLLDGYDIEGNNLSSFFWSIIHQQEFYTWDEKVVVVGYPLVPWIGVMALGYCLGSLYAGSVDPARRQRVLWQLGAAMIILFAVLRMTNLYGDPSPWTQQSTPVFALLSFLNTTKYPPSLLYVLMTIGPALLFLAFSENVNNTAARIISIYGRVPLFYYVIHVYLLHLIALFAVELVPGFEWTDMILRQPLWFQEDLKGYGFSLGIVYLVWISIVVGLYPLCKWYDRYKQSHKEKWWLSYL
ncbi:MAG TPA: heparan-alpha-glucosaminide N-acetyltransferase domain-containing protein [Cyclobacteriaceae bacterium]|nr:heparan-alpha-glucosaminide N-acetyltransferase domain-containing protein [Cyclobacteriaceae bacterium]